MPLLDAQRKLPGRNVLRGERGYDLNRDWLELDAPETRALVALAAAWRPDLVIDDHVNDGADFQPTLTLAYNAEPMTPQPVAEWLSKVVPRAQRDAEELGFGTFPYVDFVDDLDPASRRRPFPVPRRTRWRPAGPTSRSG